MNNTVFWGVTSYSSERAQRFYATYHFHLQAVRVRQAKLGLLLNPEDGGDMFLRIVWLCPNFTALQPRTQYTLFK
jgi:hypothetical protein